MKTIQIRIDNEYEEIIEDLKQDFYNSTGAAINTSQLIRMLIQQADEKMQQNNR